MKRWSQIAAVVFALVAAPLVVAQPPAGLPINPGGTAVGGQPAGPGNLSLVISQTQDVHDQIANLLNQLRRLQGTQVVVGVPFHRVQDNFFERVGVDFGFSLPGGPNIVGLDPLGRPTPDGRINFTQGGFNSALPPFGGYDPATEARTGFQIRTGGGAQLNFLLGAAQGNNRSLVTEVPTVNMMDGQLAAVSDVTQRPFVTGVIPVVGGLGPVMPSYGPVMRPVVTSPLQQTIRRYYQQRAAGRIGRSAKGDRRPATRPLADPRLSPEAKMQLKVAVAQQSSAGRGDLSVAEIRRRKEAEEAARRQARQQEVLVLIERARGAEEAGKLGAARVYYRQAADRATGEQKQQLLEKLESLKNR